jgi:hypothetical protein
MVDRSTLEPEPVRFTRTGWRRLEPLVCLHRILADDSSIEWGTFRYQTQRDRQGRPDGPPVPDEQLWFQLELTQDLTPYILICRGTAAGVLPWLHPLYGEDLDSADVVRLDEVPELVSHFDGRMLASVPRIEAVPLIDGVVAGEPVPVFAGGTAGRVLRYLLCTDGPVLELGRSGLVTAGRNAVPGAVGDTCLPAVSTPGTRPISYLFRAVLGDHAVDIGAPIAPPRFKGAPDGAECWAVLDQTGLLRLHTGYPSYLAQVSTIADMERTEGSVWRAPMAKGLSMWNPQWDPFTGDH